MSESADLVEKAESLAFDLEMKYGCCPQCVLTAVKDTVGGVSDNTIKASHGLSGGGGLMGQGACGALTGGLLALSTKRGRDADKLDKGRGMSNFQIGRKLVDRFVNEYGGVTCEALQQRFTGRTWDMWNPVEYK
ncbi:MAG: C-GCAxxG-C-C family protein, partial [Chromatiales bacterium]|nr:C-GCAxxG-C-C family protein [Chromatiales bacterium]